MYSKMKCVCFCFVGTRQYSRCVFVWELKLWSAYVLAEKGGDMSNPSGTLGTVVTVG